MLLSMARPLSKQAPKLYLLAGGAILGIRTKGSFALVSFKKRYRNRTQANAQSVIGPMTKKYSKGPTDSLSPLSHNNKT